MEKNNMRHEVWRSLRDGDYQEYDVWDVLDGYHQSSFMIRNHTTITCSSAQSLLPREPMTIPESRKGMTPMRQHSAPINVPEWPMVHRGKTKKVDDDDDDDNNDDDYDDSDDDENMSAEEFFMRRSRSSSTSVMEGIARKLKGRDLCNVRNALLKKTGFLE